MKDGKFITKSSPPFGALSRLILESWTQNSVVNPSNAVILVCK